MKKYEIHPAAALFPLMDKSKLEELADDIIENGQRSLIMVWQDQIIDGRNRLAACELRGAEPQFHNCNKEFENEEAVIRYIMSVNIHRRHMTSSQLSTVAVELLPMLKAEAKERMIRGKSDPSEIIREGRAVEKAAAIVGTNSKYVESAAKLKDEAPEAFEEVRQGKKTIPQAMRENAPKERRVRRDIDQVIAEEERLVDGVISDLTNATKKLRKCVDQFGLSKTSIERIKGALTELVDLTPH